MSMMHTRKIRGYDLSLGQAGWKCDCAFTVTTVNQYTDEEHVVRSYSKWMILALIKSRLLAESTAREIKAKPGERAAKGWI
jgi:hypothetical protein